MSGPAMGSRLPLLVATALALAAALLLPLLFRRGQHVLLIRTCIRLTAFCCWIFWATVYAAQMNPLIAPELLARDLAWLAHKWGDPA
ncbi:V-type proton ATPase subunit e-like [Plutella xylostella]|uniref:V-type proton ATPase subunit e-like n=1 Tax=Plutella xylostella TaxID=51655 RepID=UPI0018D0B709|nr:V-type proton ATPase subunit e-like [Plutella xylostella]